jgi:hypothetical protein
MLPHRFNKRDNNMNQAESIAYILCFPQKTSLKNSPLFRNEKLFLSPIMSVSNSSSGKVLPFYVVQHAMSF